MFQINSYCLPAARKLCVLDTVTDGGAARHAVAGAGGVPGHGAVGVPAAGSAHAARPGRGGGRLPGELDTAWCWKYRKKNVKNRTTFILRVQETETQLEGAHFERI